MKLSAALEGCMKHGDRYFKRLGGKFPLISQWLFQAPTKAHKLSSLLLGVIFFTNSSWRPTRSANWTFFAAAEVGTVFSGLLACDSIYTAARFLYFSHRVKVFPLGDHSSSAVVRANSGRWRQLRNQKIEKVTIFSAKSDSLSLQNWTTLWK